MTHTLTLTGGVGFPILGIPADDVMLRCGDCPIIIEQAVAINSIFGYN